MVNLEIIYRGDSILLRGTLNNYRMRTCTASKLRDYLIRYYGVVTVTETDLGPRWLLTTAAISYV